VFIRVHRWLKLFSFLLTAILKNFACTLNWFCYYFCREGASASAKATADRSSCAKATEDKAAGVNPPSPTGRRRRGRSLTFESDAGLDAGCRILDAGEAQCFRPGGFLLSSILHPPSSLAFRGSGLGIFAVLHPGWPCGFRSMQQLVTLGRYALSRLVSVICRGLSRITGLKNKKFFSASLGNA